MFRAKTGSLVNTCGSFHPHLALFLWMFLKWSWCSLFFWHALDPLSTAHLPCTPRGPRRRVRPSPQPRAGDPRETATRASCGGRGGALACRGSPQDPRARAGERARTSVSRPGSPPFRSRRSPACMSAAARRGPLEHGRRGAADHAVSCRPRSLQGMRERVCDKSLT